MRFVFYTHSLVSDWNHGNAHFQRGVMRALNALGHQTLALEPSDSWSRRMLQSEGIDPVSLFEASFPDLAWQVYGAAFDHEAALQGVDVAVVHEWTDPALVAQLGALKRRGAPFTLIFHDTHHRAISADREIGRLELDDYDLVLTFGEALRERYLRSGWGRQVATWHEAADDSLFRPDPYVSRQRDLVWVGNWGDGERSEELREFLLGPVGSLGLSARVHGVRYPAEALEALQAAGIDYAGWIANARVPSAFAEARVTVHVPRRPYVTALPGIPTIRVFEALGCGVPLICAPWSDSEGLFRPGTDYLIARDGAQMTSHLQAVLSDREMADEMARAGRETILARHTCRHRAQELLGLLAELRAGNMEAAE